MKAALWILGGTAIVVGAAAVLSSEAPARTGFSRSRFLSPYNAIRGMPTPEGYRVEYAPDGNVTYFYTDARAAGAVGKVLPGLLPRIGDAVQWGAPSGFTLDGKLEAMWKARRAVLPADADPLKTDRYSKELYIYRRTSFTPNLGYGGTFQAYGLGSVCVVDEFGRQASCASSANQLPALLLRLADTALPIVAVVVPGYGTAIYGAYLMVRATAQSGDWKDLALAAARSQIPPGPAQVAFDLGVAVVLKHESLPEAGEQALLNQLTPGQREMYERGKEAAKAGLSGDYGEAARQSLLAYYTPR